MSVRAVKAVVWLAVAAALAMFFASASPAFDRRESIAFFAAACALLIGIALWYWRVIPAAEARDEEARARQVAALKQQVVLTGETIAVKASSGILVLVLMGAIALAFGSRAVATPNIESVTVFALSVALALFLALWSLPMIGKPALIVRRDGLETALVGFLSWQEIESIGIRTYSTKGITSHSLHLYIPRLEEREKHLGFLQRMRRRMTRGAEANFVVIPLGSPSPPAPVVHALCYELWRERTGRTSVATTAPSRDFLEMKRRADEQLAALERVNSLAQTDPAAAIKLIEEVKTQFPPEVPQPKRRLSSGQKARLESMMAEMRTIDPRDGAARKRIFDKHVKAEVRRGTVIGIVLIILGFALVMGAAILSSG